MRITDLNLLVGGVGDALRESSSVLNSPEPLVVDPENGLDDETVRRAAVTLAQLPAPTVLTGPVTLPTELVAAVDMCLTSVPDPPRPWVHGRVDEVEEMVGRQALAALSLVVLLRTARSMSTWEAAAAESATYAMLLGSAPFHDWLDRRGPGHLKPHRRPPVAQDRAGNTLRLRFDRPEARNAIDSATRDALVEALQVAAWDPALLIELRGNGPCFSAGGDTEEFGTVRDPATAHAVRLTRHPGLALDAVASRVTCYLHGTCVGSGIEIPAFAASVIADPATTFRLPEIAMGLIPGAGGTVSITRRIGRHRAAWLAVTGATIDASMARLWGLVDREEPQ